MKNEQPRAQSCECSRCTTGWDERQEQIRAAQQEAARQSPEVLASYRDKRSLVEQGRAALDGFGAAHGRIGCAVAGDVARTSYAMASTLSSPMTDSPAFQRLEKTFTRAEVLAVLRVFRAIAPSVDASGEREKAAADIAAIFGER